MLHSCRPGPAFALGPRPQAVSAEPLTEVVVGVGVWETLEGEQK